MAAPARDAHIVPRGVNTPRPETDRYCPERPYPAVSARNAGHPETISRGARQNLSAVDLPGDDHVDLPSPYRVVAPTRPVTVWPFFVLLAMLAVVVAHG